MWITYSGLVKKHKGCWIIDNTGGAGFPRESVAEKWNNWGNGQKWNGRKILGKIIILAKWTEY